MPSKGLGGTLSFTIESDCIRACNTDAGIGLLRQSRIRVQPRYCKNGHRLKTSTNQLISY